MPERGAFTLPCRVREAVQTRDFLHHGAPQGLATTPSQVLPRGTPIAAGDVNRDGRPDPDNDCDGVGDILLVAGFGVVVQRFDAPGARPAVLTVVGAAGGAGAVYR